jgi:chorismate-pyruvate lyase
MDSLDILAKLEKERKLTTLEKILAVTNGSVTQILEIYLGEPIKIRTVKQEVKEAGEIAGKLGVKESDDVNIREVEITDQRENVLIKARSWAPLKRLEPGFKEDLMRADVPIGKLLIKHRIEARRELLSVGIKGNRLYRAYNMMRNGEILMRIEENFELGRFK